MFSSIFNLKLSFALKFIISCKIHKMNLIQQGFEVLYIWNEQKIEEIEQQVNEIKKIANVKLENSERLSLGKFAVILKVKID